MRGADSRLLTMRQESIFHARKVKQAKTITKQKEGIGRATSEGSMRIWPTVCPRSSDPFYIVIYYRKWVTTSWTYSIILFAHPKNLGLLQWCLFSKGWIKYRIFFGNLMVFDYILLSKISKGYPTIYQGFVKIDRDLHTNIYLRKAPLIGQSP